MNKYVLYEKHICKIIEASNGDHIIGKTATGTGVIMIQRIDKGFINTISGPSGILTIPLSEVKVLIPGKLETIKLLYGK